MIGFKAKELAILFIIILFSSCHNKELCPECDKETGVEVKFDWSDVSEIPDGMTVLFYNMQNELVYTFNNISSQGETVRIDEGSYHVACYNNDTEYVEWSNESDLDSLQVYTRKPVSPKSVLNRTLDIPDEEVVEYPDFLCGTISGEEKILAYVNYEQVILLKPEPLLDSYTYSVNNIQNGQYISKTAATLTGLSKRLYLENQTHQNGVVSMTFSDNKLTGDCSSAIGNMYNLGYYHNKGNHNYLILYIWSPGGNLRAIFDVTDQVRKAPDPRNVHIVIDQKIVVPTPIDGDEGIDPTVDEWKDLTYDVIL